MLILQILVILAYCFICATQTPVYVNTNVGNIMGFQEYISVDGEKKLISKFLGIPFGESTGGMNRFRKPVPKAPFSSTFDARKEPAACYQQSVQSTDLYKNVFGVSEFSEDCLTLNIYVPNELRANDLRPVMIWIYGGGFIQGAASIYNPEALAVFGNVIVVTFNYRVGMFGFLRDIKGFFPGNQGLWDQHLAIKWVHDHIDSFFGYKDEVTIFGESAGGASVIFQALYPGNKGLFKRVIAESGSATAPWAVLNASSYEEYFNHQGCDPNSNSLVTCLQSKATISLHSNITTVGPVIDGDFIADSPIEIIHGNSTNTSNARNFFASLDIIVGANNIDGGTYVDRYQMALNRSSLEYNISRAEFRDTVVPVAVNQIINRPVGNAKVALEKALTFFYTNWKNPDDNISIRQHTIEMSTDAAFFAPAFQTVGAHASLNKGKTYLYEFAVDIRTHFIPVPSWMTGSNHADELQFVFGFPLLVNASMVGINNFSYSYDQKQVARATMAMWSNFAKSGNPNIPMDITKVTNTTWPTYDMTSQRYFRISDQMSSASIMEGFYLKRMAFWSDVIPEIKKQHCSQQKLPDIVHFDPSTELVG